MKIKQLILAFSILMPVKISCLESENKAINENLHKVDVEFNNDINQFNNFIYQQIELGHVNIIDKRDTHALHHAAFWRSIEIVKYLVQNGANINIQDSLKRTPLIKAIQSRKNYDMINLLLNLNANVNIQDYEGNTALMNVVSIQFEEAPLYFKMLIEKGADTTIVNKDGKTVFDLVDNMHKSTIKKIYDEYKNNIKLQFKEKLDPFVPTSVLQDIIVDYLYFSWHNLE